MCLSPRVTMNQNQKLLNCSYLKQQSPPVFCVLHMCMYCITVVIDIFKVILQHQRCADTGCSLEYLLDARIVQVDSEKKSGNSVLWTWHSDHNMMCKFLFLLKMPLADSVVWSRGNFDSYAERQLPLYNPFRT